MVNKELLAGLLGALSNPLKLCGHFFFYQNDMSHELIAGAILTLLDRNVHFVPKSQQLWLCDWNIF